MTDIEVASSLYLWSTIQIQHIFQIVPKYNGYFSNGTGIITLKQFKWEKETP